MALQELRKQGANHESPFTGPSDWHVTRSRQLAGEHPEPFDHRTIVRWLRVLRTLPGGAPRRSKSNGFAYPFPFQILSFHEGISVQNHLLLAPFCRSGFFFSVPRIMDTFFCATVQRCISFFASRYAV